MQIKLKQAIYDLYTGILILYAMYESNYDEEYLNAYVYKIKYKYMNYAYNRRTGQEYKCKRKGIREKEEIVVSSYEENIICEITDIERVHRAFNYFESYIENDDYQLAKELARLESKIKGA